MGVVINNLSILLPTLFPGRASVVMDSGVDGWQGVTGKLFINHYHLIVRVLVVRSSTYDNLGTPYHT